MYHYVRDRFDPPLNRIHGLDRQAFIRQVDWLLERFEPAVDPGGSIDRPGVLFTFDDGLSDHVEVAAPLLEERGVRGIFLIGARPFVQRRMTPAHMVHLLTCHLSQGRLIRAADEWLNRHAPAGRWRERLDVAAAWAMYHYEEPELAEFKYLVNVFLPVELRDRMLDELFTEYVGPMEPWLARWYGRIDQWRDLQARGHVIGGHGFTHEPLTRLTPGNAIRDLRLCAGFLREHFGERPRPFSYPFGAWNAELAAACREAGFACAYTTRPGWNSRHTPSFELRRVDTIAVDRFLLGGRP